MGPVQPSVGNLLLRRLGADEFALIAGGLEPVELPKRMMLAAVGAPVDAAYFPESGLGSVVAISPEGHKSEVGLFGVDGMAGLSLLLDVPIGCHEVVMQVGGRGHRIAAGALRAAIDRSPALHRSLLHYVHAFTVQTSFTALSNANHTIEERLARWLLMSHDRHDGDMIALTHDFLALMLAVRRPSVTTALHTLEGAHFVRASRGMIHITDRKGLEDFAADAYGPPEEDYERLIAPIRRRA